MKIKTWKKIWFLLALFVCAFCLPIYVDAQDDVPSIDWFQIIAELEWSGLDEAQQAVNKIWQTWWKVMDTYREEASKLTTEQQLASWVMDRNTIINYLIFVIKFLGQLWLAVWVVFIIIAGYKYMVSIFNWQKTWKDYVKNAIIWVIIVIFSYAIMKILTSLVWLS